MRHAEGILPLALLLPEIKSLKDECVNTLTPSGFGLMQDTLNTFIKTVNKEITLNQNIDTTDKEEIDKIQAKVKEILLTKG